MVGRSDGPVFLYHAWREKEGEKRASFGEERKRVAINPYGGDGWRGGRIREKERNWTTGSGVSFALKRSAKLAELKKESFVHPCRNAGWGWRVIGVFWTCRIPPNLTQKWEGADLAAEGCIHELLALFCCCCGAAASLMICEAPPQKKVISFAKTVGR